MTTKEFHTLPYPPPQPVITAVKVCAACGDSAVFEGELKSADPGERVKATSLVWGPAAGDQQQFHQGVQTVQGSSQQVVHLPAYTATGFKPATRYVVRLASIDRYGNRSLPADSVQQFTTAGMAVDAVQTSAVTANAATVVGRVNPNGLSGSYWLEYSDGSDGAAVSSTPVTVEAVQAWLPVQVQLEGLQPQTEYRYQLVARDLNGVVSRTDPIPFRTPAALTVPVLTVPAGTVPLPTLSQEPPPPARELVITSDTLSADQQGQVKVALHCASSEVCAGKLSVKVAQARRTGKGQSVKLQPLLLGSTQFQVAAGKDQDVKFKLSAKALQLLKLQGNLIVNVLTEMSDLQNHKVQGSKTVPLRYGAGPR